MRMSFPDQAMLLPSDLLDMRVQVRCSGSTQVACAQYVDQGASTRDQMLFVLINASKKTIKAGSSVTFVLNVGSLH